MFWAIIFFRLGIIFIVSGLIGYDRQYKNKPAGIKTHILVGLGSGIIALVQIEANETLIHQALENPELINIFKVDNGRLIAQVISGIGFLGAGTIIVTKGHVKGLTTAASLWATATIGISMGSGFLKLGLISSLFVIAALVGVNKCIRFKSSKKMKITYLDFEKTQPTIEQTFQQEEIGIENCQFSFDRVDKEYCVVTYILLIPPSASVESLAHKLRGCEGVVRVSVSDVQ